MKNFNKKLIPIIYAIKTSPRMIAEITRTPFHIQRQNKDWEQITQRFKELESYQKEKSELLELLRPAHKDFIKNYSAPLISMSLNRGAFFYFFCKVLKPTTILDLGSGFSSYVFRLYQKNISSNTKVFSVDDSEFWLEETKKYLESYNVSTENLITLNKSLKDTSTNYDLIFLDIGDIPLRVELLPSLLNKVKKGSTLIIDDFHSPHYRKEIERLCKEFSVKCFSLRKVTRTRLSHNALVLP